MQLILFSIIALACVTAFPSNKTITDNLEDNVKAFYDALNASNHSLATSLNRTSDCPCNVFNAYALDQIPVFTQEFIGCQTEPNSTEVDKCIVEKLCKPLKDLAENPCGGFFNNTIHFDYPQKAQLVSNLLVECEKLMSAAIKINDTCKANDVEDYTVFAVNYTLEANLVQYHVVKGAFTVSNLLQKNFKESVYQDEYNRPQYVEVVVVDAGSATTVRVVTDFVARKFANVTKSFAGSNGFVHILESPMSLPKSPSEVLGIMSATLSNLTAAVGRENLIKVLDDMDVLTLLAPVDSGFANFPFYSNLTDGLRVLTLKSHILTSPTPVFSTDVLQAKGAIINTSSGLELKIEVDGERVGFVYPKDDSDATYVLMADVVTSNGVIHIVDSVLRPLIDPASTNVVDNLFLDERLTDFASLIADSAPEFLQKLQNAKNATLFAPQNLTAVAMLAISEIEALLEYHTLDREILSSQLKMGQNVATTTLADKEYVRLDGAPQNMIVEASNSSVTLHSTYAAEDVNVTFPNLVSANNVVIHVVSSPVQVPYDTIPTLRAGGYEFLASSFANNTELAKMVNGVRPNGFNTTSSMFTIFAASDKAYSSLSSEANETALSVMQDQILAGRVLSGELADYLAANNDSVVITMVSGRNVTVELKDGEIYVGGWKVLEADVLTANGVVHVIEGAVGTSPSSSGLSAGVLAAIIVGGVAFLGLLCYCFFMKGEDGSSEENQPFARIP